MDFFYRTEERDRIMGDLTPNQREFLQNHLKRGKRTVFAQQLAKGKGTENGDDQALEQEILEWDLVDVIDAGAVTSELKCECGRPLRYQYIVKNGGTGEVKKFGITHFEQHTGIPASIVKGIIKGFERIDFELDEILHKHENGWDNGVVRAAMKWRIEIPEDAQTHLKLGLPLLDKQLRQVERLVKTEEMKKWEEQMKQERAEQGKKRLEAIRAAHVKTPPPPEIKRKNPKSLTFTPKVETMLDPKLQGAAIRLLEATGTASVREVCRELDQFDHPFKGTIGHSTKPKLYTPVILFLEELAKAGVLERAGGDLNDRWYSVV